MVKIKYLFDDIEGCITPCPYSVGDEYYGLNYVGSSACMSCGHWVKNDLDNRIVECNHP